MKSFERGAPQGSKILALLTRGSMAEHFSFKQALKRSRIPLALACLFVCAQAWADVDVDVKGVNDSLRRNVLAYLSFERYKKRPNIDRDTLDRLLNRVDREVHAALRPFGYYEPTVKAALEDRGGGKWRVHIDIDPGRPVIMEQIDVEVHGPGERDPLFTRITTHLPLSVGSRLSHAAYEEIKDELQRTAATYGYLDARLTSNELLVDPEKHTARVTLALDTGARYYFGETTIEQDTVNNSLVRRYLRYKQGDFFDMTLLLRTQFALDDSQYFATLEVLPGEADRKQHIVPIKITAKANKRNRYSVGAGYGTDTGPRGTLAWEDRRVNAEGHRFNTSLQEASRQTQLKSDYIIPIGDPAIEKLTFEFSINNQQPGDLITKDVSIGPSITRVTGSWQQVYYVNAVHATTEDIAEHFTDQLLVPGIQVATVPKGYLGEDLFTRTFGAELRGSTAALGSNSQFIQLHMQWERSFDLWPKWHLLLRDEIGATIVSHFNDLPGSMRYFAGGDRSVRGFAYEELSPVETVPVLDALGHPVIGADGKPETQTIRIGGKDILTGTVEVERDLPRNFGIAVFADYGNAFDKFGDPLEYAAGVGVRYRLPVLTVGIDIGQPLSRPGAGPRLNINFSTKL
jgi:translocation and assembly module TamA